MNRAFGKLGVILSLLSLACCIIFQKEQVRGTQADAEAKVGLTILKQPLGIEADTEAVLQSLTLVAVGDAIFHD